MKAFKIPEATIIRLSVYSRFLEQVDQNGVVTISSGEIAKGVGVSPAQVRKDLAYFGEFGTRGVGYNVKDLLQQTLKILGLNNEWSVIIIGAGNLGTALLSYRGFKERGFNVVGVFDSDPRKVGQEIAGLIVQSPDNISEFCKEKNIEIGILALPSQFAQESADVLAKAGIKAILNFAPKVLNLPRGIEVRNIDLSVHLEILTFNLGMKE